MVARVGVAIMAGLLLGLVTGCEQIQWDPIAVSIDQGSLVVVDCAGSGPAGVLIEQREGGRWREVMNGGDPLIVGFREPFTVDAATADALGAAWDPPVLKPGAELSVLLKYETYSNVAVFDLPAELTSPGSWLQWDGQVTPSACG